MNRTTRSRWLALALLLIVILVLVRLLLLPLWHQWAALATDVDQLETRQAVYERLISALPEQQQRLEQLEAQASLEPLTLDESTPALAAARLQQLLHARAGQEGMQVISTQIINTEESGTLQPVAIQAQLRGSLAELVGLLYQLEGGQPLLFIDTLVVLSNPRAQRQPERRDHLDVRLNLTGYTPEEAVP
ncbi:type II secretion system protein GspM [Marinobacterium weihaiense]|uniref:Type II secretion system protein M n=1 Tax=Marinobacterium weihaiense TaxID=2851016 RepID=A0ABS6MEX1_9GAMM|nr:type II secretion system protein GspM [Marinobacterium weihaiense]MBV0934277.1 type II secretion system protein M [Marinobacterium weihaiense]